MNWRPWKISLSPGLSSQPASMEPIMTTLPPAAMALTMSPEYFMPPSAMMGTPYLSAISALWSMAVICGTPMPETTRVVHIEPGPMPTLTQSAPALMRASVPSAVATLPAMRPTSGKCSFTSATQRMMLALWPWAESRTRASTPAETSAPARSSMSFVTPIAAAQSRRPWESFAELGYFTTFSMSFMVMRPLSRKSASTMGSFSILWRRSISFASSSVVPSRPVTRPSLVMTSRIGRLMSSSNFMSRFVMMPMSLPPSSTMGTPEMRNLPMRASASPMVLSGPR